MRGNLAGSQNSKRADPIETISWGETLVQKYLLKFFVLYDNIET